MSDKTNAICVILGIFFCILSFLFALKGKKARKNISVSGKKEKRGVHFLSPRDEKIIKLVLSGAVVDEELAKKIDPSLSAEDVRKEIKRLASMGYLNL